MAAPGQNPRSYIYKDETIMATKVLTKGKQGRAAGKTPDGGLGFWAGAILKENNTTYHQGPKKQPSPLKEPGCTQVFINKEREVSASRSTKRYKIMKNFSLLLMLLALLTVFNGCQKDDQQVSVLQSKELIIEAFKPTYDVGVKNGMLVFESKLAFDVTKLEIAGADRKAVDLWEQKLGIETPASIFQAVVFAEDSVSKYFESLPRSEQAYWKTQPEIHSEIYQKALSEQIIQLLPDGDGGEYFDLNLSDKTAAYVVNLEGLVIVEGQIHQYTSNAIKLITDGDLGKIEKLKMINETYQDENILVAVFDNMASNSDNQLKSAGFQSNKNWTRTTNWTSVSSKKRVKVWIDGHSELYGAYAQDYCSEYASCTFYVRAEAMEKNFWGNWKYTSYMPGFSFNAEWYYEYKDYSCDPYVTQGCGVYNCAKHYVPAYSCTANPSYVCPTSPHSAYYPSVNNAFLPLTPHGVWRSSPIWFYEPFMVRQCTFIGTIDGKTFTYSWNV